MGTGVLFLIIEYLATVREMVSSYAYCTVTFEHKMLFNLKVQTPDSF